MAFEPKFVPQGDVKGKDSCATESQDLVRGDKLKTSILESSLDLTATLL